MEGGDDFVVPKELAPPYQGWISSFAEGKSLALCVHQLALTLTLALALAWPYPNPSLALTLTLTTDPDH